MLSIPFGYVISKWPKLLERAQISPVLEVIPDACFQSKKIDVNRGIKQIVEIKVSMAINKNLRFYASLEI